MITRQYLRILAVAGAAVWALAPGAVADELSALEIVEKVRDMWRGETFHAVVSIEVTRQERTEVQRVEVWAEGEDRALVRVLEPEEDAGSGYLLVGEKLWYYAHEVEEVVSLPGFALFEGFLGSGLDLDELLRGTVAEHYEVSFAEEQPAEGYKVVLTPLPAAPVVYGKLVLTVGESFVVSAVDYYDQRGKVVKEARVPEVFELPDRMVPRVWVVEDEVGERTVVTYEELAVDEPLPEDIFTLERLKQP